MVITNRSDLRAYLDNALGCYVFPADVDRATDFLAAHKDRPDWGSDWAEWLDSVWSLVRDVAEEGP